MIIARFSSPLVAFHLHFHHRPGRVKGEGGLGARQGGGRGVLGGEGLCVCLEFLFVVEVGVRESSSIAAEARPSFSPSFHNFLLTSSIQEWTLAYASSSSDEAREAWENVEEKERERKNVEPKKRN